MNAYEHNFEIYKGKLKEKLIEYNINWQTHNLDERL